MFEKKTPGNTGATWDDIVKNNLEVPTVARYVRLTVLAPSPSNGHIAVRMEVSVHRVLERPY